MCVCARLSVCLCVYVCMSASLHGRCGDLRRIFGVHSVLQQCGSWGLDLVVRLSSKWFNSMSYLIGPHDEIFLLTMFHCVCVSIGGSVCHDRGL